VKAPRNVRQTGRHSPVTQIFNLLYRRFAIGQRFEFARVLHYWTPAGCKPAIRQIENLRYFQTPEALP
jgi:hypothetical protein